MSELYSEVLVKKNPSPADNLKKIGMIAGVVILAIGGLFVTPVLFIAAIALGVAAYFLLPKLQVEYEYLILNKELDVDVIYSQKKRKSAGKFDLNSMDLMAPLNSVRMDYYNGDVRMKICDYTSGAPGIVPYAMIIKKDQANAKVLLELDKETVENIRKSYPNKVFLD